MFRKLLYFTIVISLLMAAACGGTPGTGPAPLSTPRGTADQICNTTHNRLPIPQDNNGNNAAAYAVPAIAGLGGLIRLSDGMYQLEPNALENVSEFSPIQLARTKDIFTLLKGEVGAADRFGQPVLLGSSTDDVVAQEIAMEISAGITRGNMANKWTPKYYWGGWNETDFTRIVTMVDVDDQLYVVKIQSVNLALEDVEYLRLIAAYSEGKFDVAHVTATRLGNTDYAISISQAFVDEAGVPLPTLDENAINYKLTELDDLAKAVYSAQKRMLVTEVISDAATGLQTTRYAYDALPHNIIRKADGRFVIFDIRGSNSVGITVSAEGKIGDRAGLFLSSVKKQWNGWLEDVQFSQKAVVLAPDEVQAVTIVNPPAEAGLKGPTLVNVANKSKISIRIPQEMTWDMLTKYTVWGFAALTGAAVGMVVNDEVLNADDQLTVSKQPLFSSDQTAMPFAFVLEEEQNWRLSRSWSIGIDRAYDAVRDHEFIRRVRAAVDVDLGANYQQLELADDTRSYALPAYFCRVNGQMMLVFDKPSWSTAQDADQYQLALIPQVVDPILTQPMTWDELNALSAELYDSAPTTIMYRLQYLYEKGQIIFFTLDTERNLVFGAKMVDDAGYHITIRWLPWSEKVHADTFENGLRLFNAGDYRPLTAEEADIWGVPLKPEAYLWPTPQP